MTPVPPPQTDAYKLAALQALAAGGSAAKADLDRTRAAMEASRQSMTKTAATEAARYGIEQSALTAPVDKAYSHASGVLDRVAAPSIARFDALAAPTANVFDTKAAAAAAKAARGGGGGGGSGRKEKEEDPWDDLLDQYGGQENFVFQIKKQNPGTKFGDNRSAYKQAVEMGMPDYTAQRVFATNDVVNQVYDKLASAASAGISGGQVRQYLNQLQVDKQIPAGAVTYYVQQYQQMPKKAKAKPKSRGRR